MKNRKKQPQKDIQKPTIRERVADSLDASKEVILDFARLEFIGNREVTVENYKSIVEYTEKQIIVETNPHRIKIQGAELEIKSIAREILYITGKISSVEFKLEV
ncbi:MAG: YabP/YqfC family sporulation protein [Clostridia bacterium]|nr:YabP/YqfC family sporulation protein [Clostridia bacterium]MBR6523985.1 YabP/YqfC family sporulation protein [Clostridia bacterium]